MRKFFWILAGIIYLLLVILVLVSIILYIGGCAVRQPVRVRDCSATGTLPDNCKLYYVRELKDRTEVVCERSQIVGIRFRQTSQLYTYRCKNQIEEIR